MMGETAVTFFSQLLGATRPLQNPIGFGPLDWLLLLVALGFASAVVVRAWLAPYWAEITERTRLASFFLFAIILRLALLPVAPIPVPSGADDFGYLLLADTLRHGRLANPSHSFHRFFESVFVVQEPTYSAIYPLGQGIALALGQILLGSWWAGVLLTTAAIPALCYWMLRGFVSSKWAFAGGFVSLIQFGALSPWMNSYWGGSVSACAGCLIFGALPRLEQGRRYGVILGAGFGLQLLTRPFEFVLVAGCLAVLWLFWGRAQTGQVLVSLAVFAPALLLTGLQNRAVTGSWTTLPYMLSRYQYGVPTTFTFQANPVPHRALTAEQDLDYRAQAAVHGSGPETLASFLQRLSGRLRYLRFFWLAPLFVAGAAFLLERKDRRWLGATLCVAVVILGANFYPYFYPHYVAVLTCLFALIAVIGLQSRSLRCVRSLILALCGVHFGLQYAAQLCPNLLPDDAWIFVNGPDPQGRATIAKELERAPGTHLVFVRYAPWHRFSEWVANAADIDGARTVWAADLGEEENQRLIGHYPKRSVWLLEPDARPPLLKAYDGSANPFQPLH